MKIDKYTLRFGKYLNGNLSVRLYKDKINYYGISIKVDEILKPNQFYFDSKMYPHLQELLLNSFYFINKNIYFDDYPLFEHIKINKNLLYITKKPLM